MSCARREAGAHRPAASAPSRAPSSRQSPRRDRSRPDPCGGRARLSLLLPVLALLLGALGLFSAAPAQAQTAIKLVSNTGQTSVGGAGFSFDNAQAFTTGSNATGYKLTRVDIQIKDSSTTKPTYSVHIYSNSSGSPGSSVGTLANPTSLPTGNNQLAQFTASGGGIDLAANTTYFVVIDVSDDGAGAVEISTAGSDAEDSGGAAGWSIGDVDLYRDLGSIGAWTSYQYSMKIAVHGYAKTGGTPPPPPPTTGTTVWSATLTVDKDTAGTELGCANDDYITTIANCSSALSTRQFTYSEKKYRVIVVTLQPSLGTGYLRVVFNKNIATRVRNALTLHVGSARFALSDSDLKSGVTVDFNNTGLTWTDGQKVSLRLTTGDVGTGTPTQPTAGPPGAFWTTTLAVDRSNADHRGQHFFGCREHNCSSQLPDRSFTYERVEYRITELYWHPRLGLILRLDKSLGLDLISAATLHVGDARFALRDSPHLKHPPTRRSRYAGWTTPNPGLVGGESITVSLAAPGYKGPKPTEPTGLFARPADRQVTLEWDEPGDSTITGYRVYVGKKGSSSAWSDIPGSGASTTSHTVTGLDNGAEYVFRIEAVNVAGGSKWSDKVYAKPNVPPSVTTLTGLRATAGYRQVALTWDNPQSPRVDRWEYQLRLRTEWEAWKATPGVWDGTTHRGPQESATITGLKNYLPYSFRVRGLEDGFVVVQSAAVTATPDEHAAAVWAEFEPEKKQIVVHWAPDPRAAWRTWTGTGGYCLYWKPVSDAWDAAKRECLYYTHTRTDIRGFDPNTDYDLRVTWYRPNGNGGTIGETKVRDLWEVFGTETEPEAAPPAAAPALQSARVRGAEMALRFDASLDESSAPAGSAFPVSVAGAARGVSSVSVRQDTVMLTLASAVSAGEAVTVGYAPPSTGKLRLSGGGAEVAAFSGQAVANDTPSSGEGQRQSTPEAVEPPPEPLTARFTDAPSEHNGTDGFALRVAFSAPVAGRAKDAAIEVTGGTLTRAVRVSKRQDLWKLTVQPSGYGAVTVTLPATADCSASGAVCTEDGRRLETALTHTVQGPPALSVADASAQEAAGATMDFAVTLSRAASGKVTVRYATRNGTAKKEKDYRKAKGTLTFAAGETSKTVSVGLLDDAHDEGEETFRLVLHDAKGAAIADGEATGTIENSDPLQRDWLARFGRAAASDAIAAITARLETPRDAGSHLTLAGQRVDLSGTDGGAALQQALTGFASLLGASPEAADPAGTDLPRRWLSDIGPPDRTDGQVRSIDGRQLLMGTSFRAVLGGGTGAQWTSWGQGASVSQFASATPTLSLSGETATGSLGMDYERGRLLTGFAMTHSLGEGTAQGAGRSYVMGSSVTTALPYARLALSDRLSAWGLAGTGSGRLTLDLDGATPERYGADLSMTLAAVGMRGELVTPAEAGGFALALKADAFWVRTESESASTPGGGNLAGARADASRVRAVLDGSRSFALAGGGTLTPSLELGLRNDGGDAETGTGTEIGAGLGYADPSRGLDMALRVHGLAAHADDGYSEWGVSGSLRLVPGAAGRGLSASLTPSYGVDPGGSERLWTLPDASGLVANDDAPLSSRLDTEIGYGLAGPAGLGTLTPYAGLGLAGEDSRTWRAGARWQVAPDATLGLEGTLSESAGAAPEQGVMLRSALRW